MGRIRKPIQEQKSHLTKTEKKEKEYMESKVNTDFTELYIVGLGDFYNEFAMNEYNRILKNVEQMGLVSNLEKPHLIGFCNAYARATECKNYIREKGLIVDGEVNELVKTEIAYNEEMRKFARLCGLTVDSRLKFATIKVKEEEKQISEKFGDI